MVKGAKNAKTVTEAFGEPPNVLPVRLDVTDEAKAREAARQDVEAELKDRSSRRHGLTPRRSGLTLRPRAT